MMKHVQIRVRGIVQGVGFRPFIYNLARGCGIRGTVVNDTEGVLIRAEADEGGIQSFLEGIRTGAPRLSHVTRIETEVLPPAGYDDFVIEKSRSSEERTAFYPADVAVCDDCLREFFDPSDRRHLYPFITCINCGPRFSIIRDIPYDRENTAMDAFPLCPDCAREYADPADRRFHTQPNACPACGPHLSLYTVDRELLSTDTGEIAETCVRLLKEGKVLAIKATGGFHLAADARHHGAVAELRRRKRRPWKPFALMAGSPAYLENYLWLTRAEQKLLLSKERPIVLLRQHRPMVDPLAAPGSTWQGVMLPSTPFQHLLFSIDPELVLVMTSGNVSEEPIVYRDEEAFKRLSRIADYFVTFNRDILVPCDDSVMFAAGENPFMVRRARGFIPVPMAAEAFPSKVLALGGDLKNCFALARNDFIIMSQHLGDMEDPLTHQAFRASVDHFIRVFDAEPEVIVTDLHPGYMTTMFGEELEAAGKKRLAVQHHHAHIASVLEDRGAVNRVIGLAFDGTGYGTDGTLWGSEFLVADRSGFERAAHFSYFPLPGGESAIRDVWKIGVSLLRQCRGTDHPLVEREPGAQAVLEMLDKNINAPLTCSIGRLFDGVAAILGLSRSVSAEAEAAVLLEEAALRGERPETLPALPVAGEAPFVIDIRPLVGFIVDSLESGLPVPDIALAFHFALVRAGLEAVRLIRESTGLETVALSGGVFHNRILLEGMLEVLGKDGFRVLVPRRVPFNDGCIALGQAAVAREILRSR